jgi:hypothetical protein
MRIVILGSAMLAAAVLATRPDPAAPASPWCYYDRPRPQSCRHEHVAIPVQHPLCNAYLGHALLQGRTIQAQSAEI